MPGITLAEFNEFKAAIERENVHNEIECGNFLHYAIEWLLPKTSIETKFQKEDRNYFGSSDFVISATIFDDQSKMIRHAYIWELKAPQCYIVERDDSKNRFRPTTEYVKAENQLLHYYQEALDNDGFRKRFEIMDANNIRMGGIIMGRSDRLVSNFDPKDQQNVWTALTLRQNYFYHAHGIRLLTWDRVLAFTRPPKTVDTQMGEPANER
jgi:hypothetical protein